MTNNEKLDIRLKEITNSNEEVESQEQQCSEITSGPSSLAYSGDNEEEYLRATFARLGVGHDGYLSLEELAKVCHAIGMDKVAAEVIDQLFSRLDVDGDGRISFEEFLHMFQSGGPDPSNSTTLDDSLSQDSSLMTNSSCLPSVSNTGMLVTEFGLFSTLDPEGNGCVSVSRLVEAWFSVGLNDGARLLRELGLPHRNGQKVRLRDLTAALEEELRPQQDSPQLPRQAALLTLLHEVKGLRSCLESARGERDKCRWDLGEANHRLALLAQELDDHNATMENNAQKQLSELERQYKDQIRNLQEALSRERENGREDALSDSRELLSINSHLQEEEVRLKGRLSSLEGDLKKLEVENLELSVKVNQSQNYSRTMEKQIQEFNKLKNKVAEYESLSPREEEFRKLLMKVEELLTENQRLRDSNDELIAQVDSYSSRLTLAKQDDYSLEGSCIGDYFDNSSSEGTLGGIKRRGGSSPFRKSSPEEGNSDEDESSPRGSKIRKRNSTQLNFHYLDVTSHDESFLDESLPHYDEKIRTTHGEARVTGSVPPTGTPKISQPSSLPLYLPQATAKGEADGKKVESQIFDKILTSENFFLLEEKLLEKIIKELEIEIKLLKKEKEEMAQEIISNKQPFKKNEIDSSFKSELETNFSDNSSSLTPSSSTSSKYKLRFGHKCQQCLELESRLNLALEELEMALKREKQDLFPKSEDKDITVNQLQVVIKGLEQQLSRTKTEVVLLVQESNELQKEKKRWNSSSSASVEDLTKLVRGLCQDLSSRLKRKHLRTFVTQSNDATSGPGTLGSGRDVITTILEEEEPEEGADGEGEGREEEGLESVLQKELERVGREVNALEEGWNRERDHLEKHKAVAEDRLSKTEQDLQVLRCEYEKSEDYWNLKFQEEQDYYEEERKLYDEKFSALEAKIKEYEALAESGGPVEVAGPPTGEVFSDDSDDRLSTIDESAVWERQVTDLEEEVRCLKKKLTQISDEKESMEISWREKLSNEQRNALQEVNQLKGELEQAKASCRTLETQLSSAREELEHFKKNFGHESDLLSLLNQGHVNGYEPSAESQPQPCGATDVHLTNGVPEALSSASGEATVQGTLRTQLLKYQKRIRQLEHSLKIRQKCSNEIINQTNERHKAEIQNLQSMMTSTQQMFATNLAKYKDQLTKVARGDLLVRELYLENTQLMLALQVTEERQKAAEDELRKLQMATLTQTKN